jgi:hypothetical protein
VEQLSGLDGGFLAMETRSVFGHVGSVCIVDAQGARSPLTLEHFTRTIEARLPLVPLFRRRLVTVPLGLDHPYWIEDPDFDIEFHVRELAVPAADSIAAAAIPVAVAWVSASCTARFIGSGSAAACTAIKKHNPKTRRPGRRALRVLGIIASPWREGIQKRRAMGVVPSAKDSSEQWQKALASSR